MNPNGSEEIKVLLALSDGTQEMLGELSRPEPRHGRAEFRPICSGGDESLTVYGGCQHAPRKAEPHAPKRAEITAWH
jgi:hypothetical protein